MENLKYRMYTLTMYNLSGIQKGIQSAHAITEYSIMKKTFSKYLEWVENEKTLIVLNGGTSETMVEHYNILSGYTDVVQFREPDLNNSMSAIALLVDERVWDKEKYPDEHVTMLYGDGKQTTPSKQWIESIGGEKNYELRKHLSKLRLA